MAGFEILELTGGLDVRIAVGEIGSEIQTRKGGVEERRVGDRPGRVDGERILPATAARDVERRVDVTAIAIGCQCRNVEAGADLLQIEIRHLAASTVARRSLPHRKRAGGPLGERRAGERGFARGRRSRKRQSRVK